MPKNKSIACPWGVSGKTLYATVTRTIDGYQLNSADGTFIPGTDPPYTVSIPESTVSGVYVLNESRTAWQNGLYDVSIYFQLGLAPDMSIDVLLTIGNLYIVNDQEVAAGATSVVDAIDIVLSAREVLHDKQEPKRISDALFLDWLNDAQREIAAIKANASPNTATVKFLVGARQVIPSDGIFLIEVRRNMGSDGATEGAGIEKRERAILDALHPAWYADPPGIPNSYFFDPRSPRTYLLYPPSNGEYGEIVYAATPALILNLEVGTKITINDIYKNALYSFLCAKGFELEGDTNQSAFHRSLFATAIGGGAVAEAESFAKGEEQQK